MSIFNGTYYSLTTDMLPSTALRSGLAPQQPRFRKCCALKSRLPCAVGFPQRLSLRYSTKEVSRHARWRCSSTVSSSRPAPGDEPARSGDTPGPQAEAPSTIHTKNAVVEGRRKGIELMEELKELVKSSNAELKAELLQQLSPNSVLTDSTEQLLRQVLEEVQELKVQQQQHHYQQEALADERKVRPSLQDLINSATFHENFYFSAVMTTNAARAAANAIHKGLSPQDMATYIRDKFDAVYGKYWQCVVVQGGASGCAKWLAKGPGCFTVGDWTIYLWMSRGQAAPESPGPPEHTD